jgi:hypothetical protein
MSADETDAMINTKMAAMHDTGVLKQKAIMSKARVFAGGGFAFCCTSEKENIQSVGKRTYNQAGRLHIDRSIIDSKMNMGGK